MWVKVLIIPVENTFACGLVHKLRNRTRSECIFGDFSNGMFQSKFEQA